MASMVGGKVVGRPIVCNGIQLIGCRFISQARLFFNGKSASMTPPGEDDPITLKEAASMVYRGKISASTLLLEAGRGNVDIFKVGRRWFTTLRSVREMSERCQGKRRGPGSTSIESGSNGLSEMDRVSSALVALSQTTRALKSSSRNTSPESTDRPQLRRR
jgi:hypothetical protein